MESFEWETGKCRKWLVGNKLGSSAQEPKELGKEHPV